MTILSQPARPALGYGYNGARTDTTQQSGQSPDKKVEIKNITVYVSDYTETDTTGMLSPPTVWRFSVAADINSNSFYFFTNLIHLVFFTILAYLSLHVSDQSVHHQEDQMLNP